MYGLESSVYIHCYSDSHVAVDDTDGSLLSQQKQTEPRINAEREKRELQ